MVVATREFDPIARAKFTPQVVRSLLANISQYLGYPQNSTDFENRVLSSTADIFSDHKNLLPAGITKEDFIKAGFTRSGNGHIKLEDLKSIAEGKGI